MLLEKVLQQRADELRTWLEENGRRCWKQQTHLQEGTAEQVYWHYGYLTALQDVLAQLGKRLN